MSRLKKYFHKWLSKKERPSTIDSDETAALTPPPPQTKQEYIRWFKENKENLRAHDVDQLIANPKMQRVIARSTTSQGVYAFIEQKIAKNEANTIDALVKNALRDIGDDITHMKGYETNEHKTISQRNYFRFRDQFEASIICNIKGYKNEDSRIHAYRRWISVAERLFQVHNYEAWNIVVSALALLETDLRLVNSLPLYSKNKIQDFFHLMIPDYLIKYKNKHATPNDILPISMYSNFITRANECIEDEYHSRHSSELDLSNPNYVPMKRKEELLEQLTKLKSQERIDSADIHELYQKLTYNSNYSRPLSQREIGEKTPQSKLFTHKLCPFSFWNKTDKYWENLYKIGDSLEELQEDNDDTSTQTISIEISSMR